MGSDDVSRTSDNQRPAEPLVEQQLERTSPEGSPPPAPAPESPPDRQLSGAPPEAGANDSPTEATDTVLTIDEFGRLDLRVAVVEAAERVPGTDRLLKLDLDLGAERRTIVSGIAHFYEPAALVGRRIVLVANLQPARIRGVESRGMLLAAGGRAPGEDLGLLTLDKPIPPGTRVS
jgi:methionyl-tRNA synthetase